MKTLELKLKKRILLVELPANVVVKIKGRKIFYRPAPSNVVFEEDFPKGIEEITYIKNLSKMEEEDFEELVDSTSHYYFDRRRVFKEYSYYTKYSKTKNGCLDTAKDSFKSAIESVGYYLKNQNEEFPKYITEAKKFNPKQTYLFEIKNTHK